MEISPASRSGPPPPLGPCVSCGVPSSVLCSRCKSRVFCTIRCQARDWPGHKTSCDAIVASRAAAEEAAGGGAATDVAAGAATCTASSARDELAVEAVAPGHVALRIPTAAAPVSPPTDPDASASVAPSPCLGPCSLCAAPAYLRCGRCKSRLYCGPPCQRSDWTAGHKAACKAIADASASSVDVSATGAAAAAPASRMQTCTGCDTLIAARGSDAESCKGCGAVYCTSRCRVSHAPAHITACVSEADTGAGVTIETLESRLDALQQMKGTDHNDTLRAMSDLARVLRKAGKVSVSEALRLEVIERRKRVWGCSDRSTPAPIDPCDVCGSPNAVLCGRCRSRAYCGQPCQLSDYAGHKAACRAIAASRTAGAEAAGANAADVAAVRRGEWVCTGCSKIVTPEDEAERCEGCSSPYCCERCRVSHWGAHMAACGAAAAARVLAGGSGVGGMEATLAHRLAEARRTKGSDHGKTLTAMTELAAMLSQQGKHREAEALFREVLDRGQRVCGEDHLNTLGALGNLATVLQQQDRYDEALPLSLCALGGKRRVHGPEHEQTIISANNHANLLRDMDKHLDAEELYRTTLTIARRVFGNKHRITLLSISGLASSLEDLGRLDECEPLMREALKTSRHVLGSDHPNTLGAINSFAGLLRARGRIDEAEPLYRESLATRRRTHPPIHSNVLKSVHNLGRLLWDMRRWDEAEALLMEALAGRTVTLGEGHPQTRGTAASLEALRRERSGGGGGGTGV